MFKLADNGYTDIIIYILIMVGGLIANAYRNYSKRKEKENSQNIPHAEEAHPFFPKDIFESEYEYSETEDELEVVQFEETEILDNPQSKLDTIELEKIPVPSYIEGESDFDITKDVLISDDIKNTSNIGNEDLTSVNFFEKEEEKIQKSKWEFDLKQAVIYSEILNPKYF